MFYCTKKFDDNPKQHQKNSPVSLTSSLIISDKREEEEEVYNHSLIYAKKLECGIKYLKIIEDNQVEFFQSTDFLLLRIKNIQICFTLAFAR